MMPFEKSIYLSFHWWFWVYSMVSSNSQGFLVVLNLRGKNGNKAPVDEVPTPNDQTVGEIVFFSHPKLGRIKVSNEKDLAGWVI